MKKEMKSLRNELQLIKKIPNPKASEKDPKAPKPPKAPKKGQKGNSSNSDKNTTGKGKKQAQKKVQGTAGRGA